MTSSLVNPHYQAAPYRWAAYAVFFLAFCVSFGAALVSFSKYLVFFAALWVLGYELYQHYRGTRVCGRAFGHMPVALYFLVAAYLWTLLSFLWSEAPLLQAWSVFAHKHTRLLWIIFVFYVIRTPEQVCTSLKFLVAGQCWVLLGSFALILGFPVPGAKEPSLGILYTSTLEQPIMSTLLLASAWFFAGGTQQIDISGVSASTSTRGLAPWVRWFWRVIIALLLLNVFYVMSGRTGYVVMAAALFLCLWWLLRGRWRVLAVLIPVLAIALVWHTSNRFQARVSQINHDISAYQVNRDAAKEYSQAIRLDMWRVSLLSWQNNPIIGTGVGSWPQQYAQYGGIMAGAGNPHQQYLYWLVELGLVGLLLYLAMLFSLYWQTRRLSEGARRYMQLTLIIAVLASFMNQPFHGVGTGEFFSLMFGLGLAWWRIEKTRAQAHQHG